MGLQTKRRLRNLPERIDQADAVVIEAAPACQARLDTTTTIGPRHFQALAPFRRQYGFTSPAGWILHCFSSYGERVGILQSIYPLHAWEAPTGQPYLDLQALVADKPVFVLTTNVDQQFFRVFPKKQICAFQGDFSYCQCSQPCLDDIWENSELVKKLTGYLVGVRLPEEAVPRCLDCGRVLVPWVRDDTFLEGTLWQDNLHRYYRFLRR
ncbi:MAG: hypothetical protein ACLSWS_20725 [Faecalispora jeddahensis]